MAYYVTLYSGGTLDTNIPKSEATSSEKSFELYEIIDYYGEPAIKTEPVAMFYYKTSAWAWQDNGLQAEIEYLAAQIIESYNAARNQAAAEGYDPLACKIKYFNEGVILLKGVYTGFPFHLEEETQAEPLATPTGLYADNITSDSARIGWNAVENASGYKVEYRQAAGGGQTYPWIEASD